MSSKKPVPSARQLHEDIDFVSMIQATQQLNSLCESLLDGGALTDIQGEYTEELRIALAAWIVTLNSAIAPA